MSKMSKSILLLLFALSLVMIQTTSAMSLESEREDKSTLEESPEEINDPVPEGTAEDASVTKVEIKNADKDGNKEEEANSAYKTPIGRVKHLLRKVISLLGIGGAQSRKNSRMIKGISSNPNSLGNKYRDDVRLTVGAVLGQKECVKKMVCKAGNYLKKFNGKQVILIILEKLSPKSWRETVKVFKESALNGMDCHYSCLS